MEQDGSLVSSFDRQAELTLRSDWQLTYRSVEIFPTLFLLLLSSLFVIPVPVYINCYPKSFTKNVFGSFVCDLYGTCVMDIDGH